MQTRLDRIARGEFDATLLAAAGLDRLGMPIGAPLEGFLPAPSQGAIGIEVLAENDAVRALVAAIDHDETRRCVTAERAFLAALGGDCHSAVAARAVLDAGTIGIEAEILSADGREVRSGAGGDPAALAAQLLAEASPALRAMFAA